MPEAASPCAEVSGDELMAHVRSFARHVKLSGTPEEAESLRYVAQQLRTFGFETKLLQHDAYISLPGPAKVEVAGETLAAITHSFSQPAQPGGLTAELVDTEATDWRGRIVLVDGIATPGMALRASRAGAAGQIHISPQGLLHEMCISPVWGSPTPETAGMLPSTVVCTVSAADGAALRTRLQTGAVQVTLHAAVDTGWRKTPILVADWESAPDAPFVLFSGHHDTWHFGVMDNGTANATMLELARLCALHRDQWRRGLRLCFWSGHSHGRFSGSTWYVDEHWDELNRRCVAHVNIDSPGAMGAENLANTGSMSELRPLAAEAVRHQAGQELGHARMPRGADMSFSGVGLPAIFGDMSEPWESPIMPHSPWWHTPEDLLDKVDETILVRDAQVCLHGLWRLLTDPVLPLDYAAYCTALLQELRALGDRLPLDQVIVEAERLRELAQDYVGSTALLSPLPRVGEDRGGDANGGAATSVDQLNRALMQVSRALVPMAYTQGDRFSPDPALPQLAWPVLDPIRALAKTAPGSDAARFATVAATRARNRVLHALREATLALSFS